MFQYTPTIQYAHSHGNVYEGEYPNVTGMIRGKMLSFCISEFDRILYYIYDNFQIKFPLVFDIWIIV